MRPPCAGITLIRFYGYDLSIALPLDGRGSTPGNTEVNFKIRIEFSDLCNLFSTQPFYTKYFYERDAFFASFHLYADSRLCPENVQ
jgi:hypothetical protein